MSLGAIVSKLRLVLYLHPAIVDKLGPVRTCSLIYRFYRNIRVCHFLFCIVLPFLLLYTEEKCYFREDPISSLNPFDLDFCSSSVSRSISSRYPFIRCINSSLESFAGSCFSSFRFIQLFITTQQPDSCYSSKNKWRRSRRPYHRFHQIL